MTPIVTKGGTSEPAKQTLSSGAVTPIATGGATSGPTTQILLPGTVTPIATGRATSGPANQVLLTGTVTPIATGRATSGPANQVLLPGTVTPIFTRGATSGPANQVMLPGIVTPIFTGGGTSGPAKQILLPGTVTPIATGGATSGPATQILLPGTVTPIATVRATSGPTTQILLPGTVTPIVTGGGTLGPAKQISSTGTMTSIAKGGTSEPAKQFFTSGTVTPIVTGGGTSGLGTVTPIVTGGGTSGLGMPISVAGENSGPVELKNYIVGGKLVPGFILEGTRSASGKPILVLPTVNSQGNVVGNVQQVVGKATGTVQQLPQVHSGKGEQVVTKTTGTAQQLPQVHSGKGEQVETKTTGTVQQLPQVHSGKGEQVVTKTTGTVQQLPQVHSGKGEQVVTKTTGTVQQLPQVHSGKGKQVVTKTTGTVQQLPQVHSGKGEQVVKRTERKGTVNEMLAIRRASKSVQQISTGSTLGGASGILQQSDIAKGLSSVSQGMATKIGGTSGSVIQIPPGGGVSARVQRGHDGKLATAKKPIDDHDDGETPKHPAKIRHRVCKVKNCNNSSEFFPNLRFYRMPKGDTPSLATWANKIGRPDLIKLRKTGRKFLGYVCAAHFSAKSIGIRNLTNDAVPTEQLPGQETPENGFLTEEAFKVKPDILSSLHENEDPTAAPVFLSQLKDCTERHFHFGTVKLQCLLNSDSATVTWYHNGEKIQPCKHMAVKFESKSARVTGKLDSNFKIGVATLQIPGPNSSESGLYMCQANNGDKYAVSCAYLSVIEYHTSQLAAPVVECRKCRLKFITADEPKGFLLDVTLANMAIDMAKHRDNMKPSGFDAPPNWMMKLKSTKARLGKSVIMACMYDDPEASATWYRNGKRLQVCKHYDTLLSASKDRRYTALRIMPISMDDFGMYTCVAINRRLFASSTSCILSREDEDASATSSSSDGSQQPNPDDPKEVGECTKCIMGLEPPKSPLVNDEVFQQLQIEMAQMPDLPEPSVKEKEAPKFLKEPSDVTVDYGGRLILSAMVDDPFASVSWYHKEKLIRICKHTEMVLSTSSRRRYAVLRIIPAWDVDAGKYTCIARESVSKKGSISTCEVTVEGLDSNVIERYKNKVCRRCSSGDQKLPTIQSVWSLSKPSSKGQFSTPSQNGEASVGQKRKAEDEELPPPPPDTPPRCPSPPLPMHDKDIPPLLVQKLTDRHCEPSSYRRETSVFLSCTVNVQSARHEWYHNGKKIKSCKDTKLFRPVDKKNVDDKQQKALLQIDWLHHDDDGVYTCVATNDAGSISTSCFVGNTVIGATLAKIPILECEKCIKAKKRKVIKESENKERSEETQQDGKSVNNSEKKQPGGSAESQQHVQSVNDAEKKQPGGTVESQQHVQSVNNSDKKQPGGTVESQQHVQSVNDAEKKQPGGTVESQQHVQSVNNSEKKQPGGTVESQEHVQSVNDAEKKQPGGTPESQQHVQSVNDADKKQPGGTPESQQHVQSVNDAEKKHPEVHVVQHLQGNKGNDTAPLVVTRELIGIKNVRERAIILKCRFGHASPTTCITWIYMGHRIKKCPHYQPAEKVVHGQLRGSLKLTSLSPVDMGIYTCLAHNHIDPFVSTSCNLTVKSKPMNEYLKVCKKCIDRKAVRAANYDVIMKKRRKLMKSQQDPTNTDIMHNYSMPRDQVTLLESGNRLETKSTTIATVTKEPAPAVVPLSVQYVLPTVPNVLHSSLPHQLPKPKPEISVLDASQAAPSPPMLLVSMGNQTETPHDMPKLWSTPQTVKDTLPISREIIKREFRLQKLKQRKVMLKKKVKYYRQLLHRKQVQFDKQLKGQLPNKSRAARGTQTYKKYDPQAELDKINKRHKEMKEKFHVMTGRVGNAVKEVTKLQNKLKAQELTHKETVNELKEKVADLEAALKRKETRNLGRQLQRRGRDTSAYAGFIQYMSEPSGPDLP
ncbi:uncharacterized protein [Amphiura filiformis]|uniref:uncharacterized protein n=1 Tax=Amphiura filiformis TaxID=82378 RepID=UPI003B222650